MDRRIWLAIFASISAIALCDDALILMETQGVVDINAMKSILPTESKQLFKIKAVPGQNGTKDWKYAILARNVPDISTQESYVDAVQGLKFVKSTETYRIQPDSYLKVAFINLVIKAAKIVGTLFGTLPKRPLKPFTPPWSTCSAITVDAPGRSNFFGMSIMKYGDQEALKRYGKVVMLNVFPALGVKMAYSSAPVSEKWDTFNIQDYGKKEVFCEWALSAMAVEHGPDFLKAIEKNQFFTAVAIQQSEEKPPYRDNYN